uniref:SFRICE_016534 n=1 Tax=Spodoptera frugiperda TaxID=7108 RepID=A0A2H1WCT6_SPOFR
MLRWRFFRRGYSQLNVILHNLIPPSPFHHRTTRKSARRHRFMVDIPPTRTKRFASSFLVRTARELNRLLMGRRAPPRAALPG